MRQAHRALEENVSPQLQPRAAAREGKCEGKKWREVDDVLSEALNNEDFLTVDTSGGPITDILLRRVALADSSGKVYMARHINQSNINRGNNIKFEMISGGNTGTGLIDPSSAPQLFSVICEGDNCQYVLQQAQSTLYHFVGMPPKGPLIVYGSKYVANPLVTTH